jgi:hypothetical protein
VNKGKGLPSSSLLQSGMMTVSQAVLGSSEEHVELRKNTNTIVLPSSSSSSSSAASSNAALYTKIPQFIIIYIFIIIIIIITQRVNISMDKNALFPSNTQYILPSLGMLSNTTGTNVNVATTNTGLYCFVLIDLMFWKI